LPTPTDFRGLIVLKRAARRPKDNEAVAELEAFRERHEKRQ
jgi:hypothetical protein